MKKLVAFLMLSLSIFLCGCSDLSYSEEDKSIISLPTTLTEETANGYRNPDLAFSSNVSTSSKTSSKSNCATSSKVSSSSKEEISSTSPTLPQKYLASKNSDIFHIADCSSAKRIKEENLVIFENFEEASTRGYRPCARCLKEN